MELKDITQYGEVLILWCWEVYPEEAAAREQTLEIVPNEVQFTDLFLMYYMTGRGSRDRLIRPFSSAAILGWSAVGMIVCVLVRDSGAMHRLCLSRMAGQRF
jgi:hypothetical protein